SLGIIAIFLHLLNLYALVYQSNPYLKAFLCQSTYLVILTYYAYSPAGDAVAISTTSILFIVVYSLQFHPLSANIGIVIAYYQILSHSKLWFSDKLCHQSDPKTFGTFRFYMWLITTLIISISFNVYQSYNKQVWRNYEKVKQDLIEKNKQME